MKCSLHESDAECGDVSENVNLPHHIVPLATCTRDISRHLSNIRVHDITSEYELILARAGIFSDYEDILSTYTICGKHRYKLGSGWAQADKRTVCRYPEHQGNSKPDRSINKCHSEIIYKEFGKIVPVGSGKNYTFE